MQGPKPGPPSGRLLLTGGRISTLDPAMPEASAVALSNGLVQKVGDDRSILAGRTASDRHIPLDGHRVIPGLVDSHIHPIRGGLSYNLELRWDNVPTLADAMAMLKAQAMITPPPQWVRVVGGFSLLQWPERRLPTLEEINRAAPDTPVFILHLYDRALLNRAALRAVGYTRETPDPLGGEIQREPNGDPTGLIVARPNAQILYATLAKGPRLSPEDQVNSTRQLMRELNRFGITSVVDAGGGLQNYPEDYGVIEQLARDRQLTVRIAYNIFPQNPGRELADFRHWIAQSRPGAGDVMYRHNGAGEMLVYSAADFEDFREARPDPPAHMKHELEDVIRLLCANAWPFRMHATYDQTIGRALNVIERIANEGHPVPRWFFDHAETISERNLERVRRLGGGIAVQHRMAFQGAFFAERYGPSAAAHAPPIPEMLRMGIPVGMGSDATRVSTYDPWVGLWWLVSGRDLSGTCLVPEHRRLDRLTALKLYTNGSAWFSGEQKRKGMLKAGWLGDLAVLDSDYFSVPEGDIRAIQSVLTIVGGEIVHAAGPFASMAPPLPPASPAWSPVNRFGGIPRRAAQPLARCCSHSCPTSSGPRSGHTERNWADHHWFGCPCWI